MLRLTEALLFLAPFAAFLAWWLLAASGGPSPLALSVILLVLALVGGGLVWIAEHGALGPNTAYVPAHMENSRIVEGHGVPEPPRP